MTAPNVCPTRAALDRLRRRVAALGALPTLPAVAAEALRAARDPAATVDDMVALIAKDPPLAARVLKAANSVSFGMAGTVGSLSIACVLLGMKRIARLAANASAFRTPPAGASPRDALWTHAAACAAVCEFLGRQLNQNLAAEAFVTGLIHDTGITVLDAVLHQDFESILALAAEERLPLHEAERRVLGTDHAQIGAWLAGAWNLPPQIAGALSAHHGPPCDPAEAPLGAALQAADAAARAAGFGFPRFAPPPESEKIPALPLLAGDARAWGGILALAAASAAEAGEFLAAVAKAAPPSQGA
ncbi:MAG TPA: HDOD domain-containing protein [Planctomycetota bacterium]|nr:HDOD domain-containing protein [Planctomycetota bacterium]OQC20632.1 MAG: HDOD domain protein [Planctomycetes bacterium ADurb.Bin069]HNR98756.1 HDOD domain-containing protein [Planctomycetota bacterium]HNU25464.1 HDOD domain-containing protein [Planctomycetota bacterium]HOE30412.1 HDOD domain-containing protein [Planctomycetota bacterium]